MQIQQEDDPAAEMRADGQLSSEEDKTGSQTRKMTQRKHVDALLDISEEMFLRDQEPYEYHCYSAWEDAVSFSISWYLPLALKAQIHSNTTVSDMELH